MGKIVSSVLKIAAIAVNFIPGLGQLASLAITAGLSLASAALAPKAPKVSPAQRERLYATIDPSTPRKIVFGQTAMATDIRYEEWSGTNQEYLDRIVVVASHKVQAIEEIWFDDKLAWTSAGGVQSPYSGYLTVQTRLEGSAGNTIAINGGSKWGSSRRLTGCAYVHLRYKTTGNSKKTESPFASSIPQRMTIKGKGALLYDPRLDSTVGGSGSQRADDQSTWAWTSDTAGNNPALQMLWYLLGWRINGKLAVGRGIPKSRILMSAFIAAANLCEEAVSLAAGGSEPRYRSAGVVSEADAPSAVIDAIEASCAGTLRDASGRLALDILHNDLATALSPGLTDADVIGQCDWQQTKGLDESFNVVRGRYTDPSNNSLYQLVDYPAVSLASPDGLERIHVFDLSMVQSASQAQRLAKQELQRAQYQGVFKGEFKATAWRCQVGSIVPFTFSALGFSNKLFRVVEQVVRMDGTCGLVLREENAAIYAWATEETAPVQAAAPTPYDPNNSPLIQGIVEGDNPNSLTINEKISNRIPKENERSGTNGRYPTVRARMVALGLSVTALDNASAAWIAHRDAVPGWNNTSFHSTIVRTTWDALDKAFDDQLNLGDIAISQEDAKRAVVGGGLVDTAGNPISSDNVRNNLALIDWWKQGATIPWPINDGGSANGIFTYPRAGYPSLLGPLGVQDDMWYCQDTVSGDQGGGWNSGQIAPLNPDKTYRFVLPVMVLGGNTGGIYWGTGGVCDLNTTTDNTNPYFAVVSKNKLTPERWYIMIGYIYPRNSTDRTNGSAGIYDTVTGQPISNPDALQNFCFRPDGSQPNHRAYQYYSNASGEVLFGKPLIECVDGSQSSLREYFRDTAVLNNQIQINASGQFVNPVGTGSGTTVANNQITIASGAIAGIGTGNGALVGNDQIQIDANGNFINAAGAGSGTNVSNALVAKKLTSFGSVAAIIEGNSFRRSSGDSDYSCWVAGEPIVGACFAEAIVAAGAWTMVALDPVSGSGSYDSQDFVVHTNPNVGTNIYSNGVNIAAGLTAPTAGQTVRVAYDGTRYQLFINNAQIGADYPAAAGKTHYPIFNAYNGNVRYSGLNYGPYSQTSAETKFIVQTSSGSALRLIGANAILRDSPGGSWDSQCYSEQGIQGGAFCSFTPTDASCYFMAGLNSDPLTSAEYSSLDYAFYMAGDGVIRIYESGGAISNPASSVTFGTWSAGTVLSIVYDNEFVRYLINGRECRAVRTSNGRKFHFDSSVVQGGAITNLRFGPVTPDSATVDFIHASDHQAQLGNSVYKNGLVAVNGWNTKSVSRQMQRGNAVISAKLPTTGTFFGLHQLGNGSITYDSLAWSFHRSDNGRWYIFEAGGVGLDMGTSYGGVTFGNETEFRIEYDGVRVRYWADGALMRDTTAGVSINITYQAGVAIFAQDQRVSNIQFGAFTDNAWPNVGGSGRPEDNATVGATAGTNLRRSNNAVVGDAEVLNTYVGPGQNLIPNSDQTMQSIFKLRWNPDALSLPWGSDPSLVKDGFGGWDTNNYEIPGNVKSVAVYQDNRVNPLPYGYGFVDYDVNRGDGTRFRTACAPGEVMIASAFFAIHRCHARIYITFEDAGGNIIDSQTADTTTTTETYANVLAEPYMKRLFVKRTAPANARSASIIVSKGNTLSGNTNSYWWCAAPMLERASVDQQAPSPYMPGPPATARQVGYLGDLNATYGATAGTNLRRSNNAVVGDAEVLNEAQQWSQVQSKDVWLIDGRIPTGIDSAGRNQVGIVAGGGNPLLNADIVGTLNGTNIAMNPEFIDGTATGYTVYNNVGGSKVTMAVEADQTAPNASGYRLAINYNGTGTPNSDPTPGFGGIVQWISDSVGAGYGGRAVPSHYARNSTIILSIIAWIPTGRSIAPASNSLGNEATFEWLTDTDGISNWKRYVLRLKIGSTGTFSTAGFFYIYGGPNTAFTWYIAKYDQIDITSTPRQVLGRAGIMREDGLPLFDADVRNQLQQWTDVQGSLKPENNADVTSYITGSAKIVIECDANGTPLSGQLTKTTVYKLLKNGIDETVNATWSSTVLSGTLTQSTANTGVNSISAISTATAKIRISATLGSAVRSFDVDVEKRLAAPETGGSGSGGTAATVPVNLSSNSTTMVTASNELIFNTGSAGSATMTGIVYFTTDGGPPHGSWSAYWIWQRWNGSTWVDVDSEVAAVQSAVVSRESDGTDWFYYDSQNGELHVGKVITGLSANSQVKFRLRVRSAGGLRTLYYNTFGVNIGGQGS